jgi:hypothetical protein
MYNQNVVSYSKKLLGPAKCNPFIQKVMDTATWSHHSRGLHHLYS